MCNPNGANAQNEIIAILQRMALDTSTISSAVTRQPTINVNCSESNGMLQKILEAIEKTSENVNELKSRFDVLERKMDELTIANSESNRKIDDVTEKILPEKFAEVQKSLNAEFAQVHQNYEKAERMMQLNWEKMTWMITKIEEDNRREQERKLEELQEVRNEAAGIQKLHEKIDVVRKEVDETRKEQQEKQQKILSQVLEELTISEIPNKQDATPEPSSSSSLVSAEKDEETIDLVVQARRTNHNGDPFEKIVVKVRLTDRVHSIRSQIYEKPQFTSNFTHVYDCYARGPVFEAKTIGEQGIHQWEAGRLCFM